MKMTRKSPAFGKTASMLVLAATAGVFTAAPLYAAPPSKRHKIEIQDANPGVFPVIGELSKLFTVEQMFELRKLVKRYSPEARPVVDRLIEANRELEASALADVLDEEAVQAGAAKIAGARADLAVIRSSFSRELRAIARPDQIVQLRELQDQAFDRLHVVAGRIAWAVDKL